jgi:nitroreductase/NAD-dependent dihydropyrimidine dehydrogenase PreA subunit
MPPVVDPTRCLKDALCTRVCPVGVLSPGEDGLPVPSSDVPCIRCGHCAAACRAGAVSVDGVRLEDLPDGWQLDVERVGRLLKGRRSIRLFRKEALAQETLATLIGVAQYAPSGHNGQPLAWTVIGSAAEVRRVAEATVAWMRASLAQGTPLSVGLGMQRVLSAWDSGCDRICRNAPHLIIAHAPAGLPSGSHSAAIAMTYLDLAAQPLGVGTCWAGFVLIGAGASAEVHAALRLPEGRKCAGIMMAGRPAVTYLRIPARNPPSIEWR